jgi:hypothetical protein
MKLKDLESWKPDVLTYWTNTITASIYENKTTLLSELNSKISGLSLTSYYNDVALLSKSKDSIFSILSYVNIKYMTVYPNGPVIPDLLSDPLGVASWYKTFNYELPLPADVFTLTLDPEPIPVNGILSWNTDISTLITGAATDDIVLIDSFISGAASSIKDSILYRVFTTEQSKSIPKDTKTYILTDLNFNQVLTEFGWEIPGLTV